MPKALFFNVPGHGHVAPSLPLLLIPQQEEQTFNAMRVVELGAGLMLKKSQVTAERIRASAMRLLADPQFRVASQRIGDTLRAAGGASRGADEIELLLANKSHGKRVLVIPAPEGDRNDE